MFSDDAVEHECPLRNTTSFMKPRLALLGPISWQIYPARRLHAVIPEVLVSTHHPDCLTRTEIREGRLHRHAHFNQAAQANVASSGADFLCRALSSAVLRMMRQESWRKLLMVFARQTEGMWIPCHTHHTPT